MRSGRVARPVGAAARDLEGIVPRTFRMAVEELAFEQGIPETHFQGVLWRAIEARWAVLAAAQKAVRSQGMLATAENVEAMAETLAGGDAIIAIRVVERLAADHEAGLLARSFAL